MKRLTSKNYFSPQMQKYYMGVSQFKSFQNCEARAMAELNGTYEREETTALLVGSYIDAYFEGKLGEFIQAHQGIVKSDGTLKSEYRQADQIIQRVCKDRLFMEYMSGKKQVIMTGEIEGVPVKIKIDSYHPGKMIVDLKVMRDFAPIYMPEQGRLTWPEAWGYDLQGAVYQEVVRQNTGDILPFFLAAATKEKEPDLQVVQIPQAYLDIELDKFRRNVAMYQMIKNGGFEPERCEKCDYCKHTKVLTNPVSLEELTHE